MRYKVGEIFTNIEVCELVMSIHYNEQDFDEGDLLERINRFTLYEIREVNVDELCTGYYYIDKDNVIKMSNLDFETMPPIVLGEKYGDKYDVVDGNHRVESAILKNRKKILAFFPIE